MKTIKFIVNKGGKGSGHFGHSGREGEQGGSLPGTGGNTALPSGIRVKPGGRSGEGNWQKYHGDPAYNEDYDGYFTNAETFKKVPGVRAPEFEQDRPAKTEEQKLSSDALDDALSDTGFSSKTKSLAAYARDADHTDIVAASKATISAKIPIEDRLAVALYLANAKMNGSMFSKFGATHGQGNVKSHFQELYSDPDAIKSLYNSMSSKTLAKWRRAYELIDEAFQGRD